MSKDRHVSETPATALLRRSKISFSEHVYDYVDRGGTAESARQLGVEEHHVVKTLVMEDEAARPLIVLMHGDRNVSTKTLARAIGAKRVQPCSPAIAERHSGYQVGGTSPFATKKRLPIYVEASILELSAVYINGGRRGYLVGLAPSVLTTLLQAKPVHCATTE
jgi:Cys-tRNA(Pro) deacylase